MLAEGMTREIALSELKIMLEKVKLACPAYYFDHLRTTIEDNIEHLTNPRKSFRDVFPSGHHGDYSHQTW